MGTANFVLVIITHNGALFTTLSRCSRIWIGQCAQGRTVDKPRQGATQAVLELSEIQNCSTMAKGPAGKNISDAGPKIHKMGLERLSMCFQSVSRICSAREPKSSGDKTTTSVSAN